MSYVPDKALDSRSRECRRVLNRISVIGRKIPGRALGFRLLPDLRHRNFVRFLGSKEQSALPISDEDTSWIALAGELNSILFLTKAGQDTNRKR